ncbi:hypothetical protein [Cystobacter fuscus]|uniref:hypothetical protein n=1 Tax=Cystobacter fuscus TaxID=43 RepID=UPI0005B93212|nr:hypothetical protein [Cystobacter fuscus]
MFRALVHGKLSREQANMEDLVTSLVFGTLEHCEPSWIAGFLRRAQLSNGTRPLHTLAEPVKVVWEFWPWIHEDGCIGCEPDVSLQLQLPEGRHVDLFLEIKFLSGKSSRDDLLTPTSEQERLPARDQLAREWQNLRKRTQQTQADDAWLLYVTPDIVMPTRDLAEAQQELLRKDKISGHIAWLSLRELHPLLRGARSGWLTSLRTALERLELLPFQGISKARHRERASWSFVRFEFKRRSSSLSWSFGGFQWTRRPMLFDWRFSK